MQNKYEVVVVGAGIIGSSCAWQLAKQNVPTLLIDQQSTPHNQGSSHGITRLIRKAYFEHPDYVPLLIRSYELWHELNQNSDSNLVNLNGVVICGTPQNEVMEGIRHSANTHQLAIEILSKTSLANLLPQIRLGEGFEAILEKDAGYTLVEASIETLHDEFTRLGGQSNLQCKMLRWDESTNGVNIHTSQGTISCDKLVIAAGPWITKLVDQCQINLIARRVPIFWVAPPDGLKMGQNGPCFGVAMPDGFFYGVPDLDGRGMKIGRHCGLEEIEDPDIPQLELKSQDWSTVATFLKKVFRIDNPIMNDYSICRYTMSDDGHFILGFLPGSENTLIASICSGHGFKFGPVVGEIVAELITKKKSSLPISFLSPMREGLSSTLG